MREFLTRTFALPIVDLVRKTSSLSLYRSYSSSQWMKAKDLQGLQLRRLRELLIHSASRVPYYRRWFERMSLNPETMTLPQGLSEFPILDKTTIRKNLEDLKSEDFERWSPREKATSGSTGEPLLYYLDKRSHGSQWANIWRAWNVAGYRPGQKYATLAGGSLAPGKTNFVQALYTCLMGSSYLPTYHISDELMRKHASSLRKSRPPYLYAYPSAVHFLSIYCEKNKIDDLTFEAVYTTSEMLLESQRERIETLFQTQVFDIYGCNDGGIIAFECEDHSGYHYNMESAFIEVVDDAGTPLPPGQSGRVVVTNLVNYAMPFIRYDTGDLAVFADATCPCNRGLLKLREIMGRTRDFVRTLDGRLLHGAFFNHLDALYEADWIERWQVHQNRADHVCLKVIPTREPTKEELSIVLRALEKGLGDGMKVSIAMEGDLPVTAAGKHKLIITEIDE
jgi:phenylacetate-CoA ligase